jgi:hypothetical protein
VASRDLRQTKIVVTRYGGPEVLTVDEQDCPAPKLGEVRVKVLAAGVSLPDVLAREGVHPETPRVPYTPGWDRCSTCCGRRGSSRWSPDGCLSAKRGTHTNCWEAEA